MNKKIVFLFPSSGFISKFEIVSCHIENDGNFLFLKRNKKRPQGGTWGVPAGKKESWESLEESVLREVYEETDLLIVQDDLSYFRKVYVRYPNYDFIYHIFLYKASYLEKSIKLNLKEHETYQWLSIEKALSMPLIPGEGECLRLIREFKFSKR